MEVLKKKCILVIICMLLASSMLYSTAKPVFAEAKVTTTVVVTSDELKLENLLLAAILANYFDVDLKVIIILRDKKHFSFLEIAMLLALAQASNKKVDAIGALRAKGHGWGVIAHKLGVHPGLFNQTREWFFWGKSRDYVVEDVIMIKVLSAYFNISNTTIKGARGKGLPFEAIAVGLNIAAKSGKSADEVFKLRTKGAAWGHIAKGFNLSEEELKKPAASKEKFKMLLEKEKKGKGEGKGKGKGKK